MLLVTSWENYVEQAISEIPEHLMTINDDPRKLSQHLQGAISRAAEMDAWTVTGNNWRFVVIGKVADLVGKLNNAASGNGDRLIVLALGIDSFLSRVSWPAYPPIDVGAEVRDLVNEVRGEIVHKGRTPSDLNTPRLEPWLSFVDRLVAESDTRLASEVIAAWEALSGNAALSQASCVHWSSADVDALLLSDSVSQRTVSGHRSGRRARTASELGWSGPWAASLMRRACSSSGRAAAGSARDCR